MTLSAILIAHRYALPCAVHIRYAIQGYVYPGIGRAMYGVEIEQTEETAAMPNIPLEVILASLPGILVALLTYWLTIRHEAILATRAAVNELALLRFEFTSNRAALAAFWQSVADFANIPPPENADEYEGLALLARNGLIGQPPSSPSWGFTRWEAISAPALSRLAEKDLAQLDQTYRSLRSISDLYSHLVTLTADERAILDGKRFWPNWYRDMRQTTYDRLSTLVAAVLAARDPLT